MRFLFINLVVAFATKDGSWIRQNRNRLGEKIENHEQNPNRRRRQISLRRPSATSVRALVEHGCYRTTTQAPDQEWTSSVTP